MYSDKAEGSFSTQQKTRLDRQGGQRLWKALKTRQGAIEDFDQEMAFYVLVTIRHSCT